MQGSIHKSALKGGEGLNAIRNQKGISHYAGHNVKGTIEKYTKTKVIKERKNGKEPTSES